MTSPQPLALSSKSEHPTSNYAALSASYKSSLVSDPQPTIPTVLSHLSWRRPNVSYQDAFALGNVRTSKPSLNKYPNQLIPMQVCTGKTQLNAEDRSDSIQECQQLHDEPCKSIQQLKFPFTTTESKVEPNCVAIADFAEASLVQSVAEVIATDTLALVPSDATLPPIIAVITTTSAAPNPVFQWPISSSPVSSPCDVWSNSQKNVCPSGISTMSLPHHDVFFCPPASLSLGGPGGQAPCRVSKRQRSVENSTASWTHSSTSIVSGVAEDADAVASSGHQRTPPHAHIPIQETGSAGEAACVAGAAVSRTEGGDPGNMWTHNQEAPRLGQWSDSDSMAGGPTGLGGGPDWAATTAAAAREADPFHDDWHAW
jgi:hypothetical protein